MSVEIGNNKFTHGSKNVFLTHPDSGVIPVFLYNLSDTTKEEPFYYDPLWEEHAAVVNECDADGYGEED